MELFPKQKDHDKLQWMTTEPMCDFVWQVPNLDWYKFQICSLRHREESLVHPLSPEVVIAKADLEHVEPTAV